MDEMTELESVLDKRHADMTAQMWHEAREARLRRAKVPELFKGALIWRQSSRAWSNTDNPGLWLWGETGTGKSHEAAALVLRAAEGGKPARFVTLGCILDECMADGSNRSEVLDKFAAIEVLAIDDVGKEKPSEFTLETFYRLIDERLNRKTRTIVTSNLSPRQFVELFRTDGGRCLEEAVMSRLMTYQTDHLTGKDWRATGDWRVR